MRYLICGIILSITLSLQGQIEKKIGEWTSYLPYNKGLSVTQGVEKIYYGTPLSVMSIHKDNTDDIRFLSKVEGLSDVGVEDVVFDNFNEQLIITYTNGNIDIVKDNDILNLSNLKVNTTIIGSKNINDVHVYDESTIFFATGFGVVIYNSEREEFSNTVFTNLSIDDITNVGTIVYASSEDGIYSFDFSSNLNIADFSTWTYLSEEVGLPTVYEATHLERFNNQLFAVIDGNLWSESESGSFIQMDLGEHADAQINFLSLGQSELLVGTQTGTKGLLLFMDGAGSIQKGAENCVNLITDAVEDQNGRIWYADEYSGIRWTEGRNFGCQKTFTNTPFAESISDIDVEDGKILIATGGVSDKYNYTSKGSRDGFYIYDENQWTRYVQDDFSVLNDVEFINNFEILAHPKNDKIFVGSFYEGLLEYDLSTGESFLYNDDNSEISNTVGDVQRARIAGLAYDDNDILWINNSSAETPLVALTEEGNTYAFDPPGLNSLAKIIVDNSGYLWSIVTGGSGGVVVYDYNGTVADPTDDVGRFITSSNSELMSGTVNTIAVDLDGEVWVGTSQGPVIFDSGPSIFDNSNRGSRRKVLQDSIPAFLLETEDIRTIEIDGANRKWFGTRNGIIVQSPSGEDQVLQFDVDNSPLFSDNIIDLEYDDDNGIMYIATDKGLQSYRTETLGSNKTHGRKVYAFPNPITPEYEGEIYIKGLARDANVKITDLNGKLVYETQSLGGQAVWNGEDYTGRRAATGVYLVFSTGEASFDTPDSFVTKIMIIN